MIKEKEKNLYHKSLRKKNKKKIMKIKFTSSTPA